MIRTMVKNKDIVRLLFSEVLNGKRLDLLDDIIDPGYVEHNPAAGQVPGAAGVRMKLEEMYEDFPDIAFTLDDIVTEGDIVAARYHWEGTHRLGSGEERRVNVTAMDFYRIKDGLIGEHWENSDEFGLLRQLGIIEEQA